MPTMTEPAESAPTPEDTPARVRRSRWERGLTRRAAADLLGVTERTVLRWEAGKGEPRPGDLDRLEALPVVPLESRRVG